MLRSVAVVAFGLIALLTSAPVEAGPAAEVRALYERFYTAQNARDLDAVRGFFLADDRFLWVSDGKSFYGPDAVLERMASFQRKRWPRPIGAAALKVRVAS